MVSTGRAVSADGALAGPSTVNRYSPSTGWPSPATVRQATRMGPAGKGATCWITVAPDTTGVPAAYDPPSAPVTSTVVNSARTGALKTSFTSGMGAVTVESGSGTASSRLTCAHAGDAGTTSTSTIVIATYHIRLSIVRLSHIRLSLPGRVPRPTRRVDSPTLTCHRSAEPSFRFPADGVRHMSGPEPARFRARPNRRVGLTSPGRAHMHQSLRRLGRRRLRAVAAVTVVVGMLVGASA